MSREDVLPDEPPAATRMFAWRSLLSWSVMLGVALLVWELTDQSGLAICVACTKFSWENLATAVWLHDCDPLRPRFRACSLFMAANAFRNIGVAATLVTQLGVRVMALVDRWQGRPPALPAQNWAWVNISIAGLCGIVAWWFLGGIGAAVATYGRRRVWVNASLHSFRRNRLWPPHPVGRNQVQLTATLGIAFLMTFFLIVPVEMLVSPLSIIWPSLPISLTIGWFLSKRIAARTPAECWPVDDPVDSLVYGTEDGFDDAGPVESGFFPAVGEPD